MRELFQKTARFFSKENRLLVFTFAFLFLFSLGTYAFASALYNPGDTNDPTCSPGDTGCYVDSFPKSNLQATTAPTVTDDSTSGYSIGSMWFDGVTGNLFVAKSVAVGAANWAPVTPTLASIIYNSSANGDNPIIGDNLLQMSGTHATVLKTSWGDDLIGTNAEENLILPSYNGSRVLVQTLSFDTNGALFSLDNSLNKKNFKIDSTASLYALGAFDAQGNKTRLSIDDANNAAYFGDESSASGAGAGVSFYGSAYPTVAPLSRGLVLSARDSLYVLGNPLPGGTSLAVNDGVAHTIQVNGNLSVTGTGGTCIIDGGTGGTACTSDQRLKTNISDLAGGLDSIKQLRPVTFNWLDPTKPQNTNIGFLAQDVQTVFPQFVSSVGNGYLGVNYAGLVTPAIKAIQELDTKVEPLTSIDVTQNGSLASLVAQFLKNATIAIQDATIGTLHVDDKVCADDVCVTKAQFKQLLLNAGGTVIPAQNPTP